MQRVWSVLRNGWWGAVLVLVLEAPVLIYRYVFGSHISTNHTRWGEMGSAMSGIYGPILSALTLFVVIRQLALQQATNKHMYDQAYLQTAREDLDFYLKELVEVLEQPFSTGGTVKLQLSQWFEKPTLELLSEEWVMQAAQAMNLRFPRVQAIVTAMYPVYGGLSSSKEGPYRLQYTSAMQRAIAMLSYPTCVALEHYIYCIRGHHMPFPAHFSPLLSPRLRN